MSSKYFSKSDIEKMDLYRKQIYEIRAKMFEDFEIDPLDTDALSSIAIYKIVTQYDKDFNINFARNGEDAKSGNVLIEQKASRVNPSPYTKKGKPRTGYDKDAGFQFHAMGTLDHPRYIFVARSEVDLSILRIYDISSKENREVVLGHLMNERQNWENKNKQLGYTQKHDVILISEMKILDDCTFTTTTVIDNCKVFKD
jgi:hypothetical protein